MLEKITGNNANYSFLFLVENELLQSSIQTYFCFLIFFNSLLETKNLTTEKILNITYTLALKKPQEEHSEPLKEWISCINSLQKARIFPFFIKKETAMTEKDYVTGLFDGSVRIYNAKHELLHNDLFHKDSVTDAMFFYLNSKCYLSTCSLDQTLHFYGYGTDKIPQLNCVGKYKDSICTLAHNPVNEKFFASGCKDGVILLWDLSELLQNEPAKKEEEISKKKKKKIELTNLAISKEISGIQTQEISKIQFIGQNQLLSGSMDHSLKLIDINKGIAITTLHTINSGVCSLDSTQNIAFTGLTDASIRQWDLRESSLKKSYTEGHTSWVKSLEINPLNRNILVSGGYDGNVLIWDIRGDKKPIQKVCTQKDKVMSVCWNGPGKIISGGSEGQLYVHSLTFDHKE